MAGMGLLAVFTLYMCLSCFDQVQGQTKATAIFDGKGIKGYINFTDESQGIRIRTSVQGLTGTHRWHVHLYPVDQTLSPDTQCTSSYVGPHYDPFNQNNGTGNYTARCIENREMCEAGDLSGKWGYLMPNSNIDVVDNTSTLFLRGRYSIVGRSVVIHASTPPYPNFECATILSVAELDGASVTVLQSTFVYPIAGVMYFKQVEGEEVQMWGKMYWVNGTGDTVDHNWHIHERNPGEVFRLGQCNTSGNIGGHYRPFGNGPPSIDNYTLICNPDLLTGCEVGDLTGKHATIDVAGSPSPYINDAFFFTDTFLNLTGDNPVINRSIAIHQADRGVPVVACAPLIASETIILRQYGLNQISISQTSPFEDTLITTSKAKEMIVVQSSAFAPLNLNCAGSPDLIFNSYPVQSNTVSSDKYPTGALSQRYGGGAGTSRVVDVPVYGSAVSISSLNLRTASDDQNSCNALIVSFTEPSVFIAKTTFTGSLRGAIYFIQRDYGEGQADSDNLGNTFIIVDIYRAAAGAVTSGHSWNVVMGTSSSGCPGTTSIFNPYSITTGGGCTPQSPLGCASGNLSGKHGVINIGSNTVSRPTYTYVDNNLLLTSQFSVLGNSVRISDANGNGELGCATINRTYISVRSISVTVRRSSDEPRSALVEAMAMEIDVDISDIVVLSQATVEVNDNTCLNVTLRTLGSSQDAANSNEAALTGKTQKIQGKFQCLDMSEEMTQIPDGAMPLIPNILAVLMTIFISSYFISSQ